MSDSQSELVASLNEVHRDYERTSVNFTLTLYPFKVHYHLRSNGLAGFLAFTIAPCEGYENFQR